MRPMRRMTWAMVLWSAVTLTITIVAALSPHPPGVVGDWVLIWALGMGILGAIWLFTRPEHERPAPPRECPACGLWAPRGQTLCPHCGHDFARAAADQAANASGDSPVR